MDFTAWTSLCDKIDEVQITLAQAKMLAFIVSMAFMIANSVLAWIMFRGGFSSNKVLMFGLFAGVGLGSLGASCWGASRSNAAVGRIEAVCEDMSQKHRALSFYLRSETRGRVGCHLSSTIYYIEVSIATEDIDTTGVLLDSALPFEHFMASAVVVTSPAERLAALDALDPEYDKQRKDIIDSV
eukprot:CAMPEP_0172512632 /NCGR_PEP_ID=MMETSP1066-20121228/246098_1 /TAXON_ID=671091 /ORGANISM="Coscinodiscus wailesii, Strain CCMP2513" /LENGTH=183 /DNA_ID=CAMNT_0013292541 /DNA_START=198 /DNA_END=749 /DNA_ORIENTATION=+